MKKLLALILLPALAFAGPSQSVTVAPQVSGGAGTGVGIFNTPSITDYKFASGQTVDFTGVTIVGFTGSTAPGGSSGQFQYNSGGTAFGGTSGLTWDGTHVQLTTVGGDFGVSFSSNSFVQPFQGQNTSTLTSANTALALFNATHNFFIGITGTGYSGSYLTGAPSGEITYVNSNYSVPLVFAVNDISGLYLDTSATPNVYTQGQIRSTTSSSLAAINVGSYAGDPSTLSNGDFWYSTSANAFRGRANGSTISFGAGGGTTTNALTFNTTGGAAAGTTFNGSAAVTVSPVTIGAGSLTTSNSWSGASNTFTYVNINDQLALGLTGLSIGSPSSSAGSTATVTPQTATLSGTIPGQFQGLYYGAPTFTDASSATLPIAATITINGAPIAGGSLAITNPYALYIPSGNVDIVGSAFLGSGSTAVTQTAGDNSTKIATDAFVLANASGGSPPTNGYAYRNLLLNGDMRIDQQNAGASVTVNSTSETFSVDQWVGYGVASAGVFTLQQSTSTPPAGFTNFLRATCSTADSSPAAGSVYVLENKIEGINCQGIAFGGSSPTSVTITFQARSSLTGTFSGALSNGTGYSYPFSFTISSANTWTSESITIAGPTAGTWLTAANTIGLVFDVDLGSGATSLGTAGAWVASSKTGVTSSTRLLGTASATFDITSAQIETGTTATPFERFDYAHELVACERNLWRSSSSGTFAIFASGFANNTTTAYCFITLPVTMMALPTLSFSTASNFVVVSPGSTTNAVSALTIYSVSPSQIMFSATTTALTAGQGLWLGYSTGTCFVQAAARL